MKEIWKNIPGISTNYSVSNFGRVMNCGRILQSKSSKGQDSVCLPFKGKISDIRNVELKLHTKMTYLMNSGIDMLMTLIPQLVPLACFSLYPSVEGKPLTSSVAFTSISLFSILQMPFAMMPMCMMLLVQFK